jgi:hypothetical protein
MMSKARDYVLYRSQGLGVRDAAVKAGYASGTPSRRAVRLWDAAQKVARGGRLTSAAIARHRERIAEMRRKAQEMEDIADVAEILVCEIVHT